MIYRHYRKNVSELIGNMHHGIEFHFGLTFSKVLRQRKLSIDAQADFTKIKFNSGNHGRDPAASVLHVFP